MNPNVPCGPSSRGAFMSTPSPLSPTLMLRAASLNGFVLAGVLRADLSRSWITGERRPVEDYLSAFPALAEQRPLVMDLVCAEFTLRMQLGPPPTVGEFLRRFPSLGIGLKPMLEMHASVATDNGDATIGSTPRLEQPSLTMQAAQACPVTLDAPPPGAEAPVSP